MKTRGHKARIAILKVLNGMGGPVGATRIMERVSSSGTVLQPRTIRFYLRQLDRDGLTSCVSRRLGRVITERGREELSRADVVEKIGFISAKVDTLVYRMSFSARAARGTIIANVATMDARGLAFALKEMRAVFAAGLGMGRKIAVAGPGERIGDCAVPPGMAGIATVCSVTVNGIMLREAIPVVSRFGGLLEMCEGKPARFVELIDYSGTTLDPLEAFIRAGMTQVRRCAQTGSGLIGASFREVPAVALDDVRRIRREMEAQGLGGILAVGQPNTPLLDIPVSEGRAGMIVIGGLNPVAAASEAGARLSLASLAGLADADRFSDFEEVYREHA